MTISAARKPRPTKRNIDVGRRAQIGVEKRARTRKAILESAFTLIGHDRGLSTRIEEVCEAAGISRGTFYNYFNSIEELFDALSYELNHDFNTAVTEFLNSLPTAAERCGAAVRYYLSRALKDPKWAWAMVHISAAGPIFGADTYSHAEATAAQGAVSGEFDAPANVGRDIQLGITLSAMMTQLKDPSLTTYPETITRHVLRALGVSAARIEEIASQPLPGIDA